MFINSDFIQKLVLLIVTALLSGFGVPYVLKVIDDRKLRRQKDFEAELVRQGKLIEAQVKLLDDLTKMLWEWRYLAKSITYYASHGERERFETSKKQYEDNVWASLNRFRTEISRSRRLMSEAAFNRLNDLYEYVVHDVDSAITRLNTQDVSANREQWNALAQRFSDEVSDRFDSDLDFLASELQLKVTG